MTVPTAGTPQKSPLPVPTGYYLHARERGPAGERLICSPLAVTTAGDISTMAGAVRRTVRGLES